MTTTDEWVPPPGKPQVSHIVRPRIPWRATDRTYCGKDPEQFKRIVSLAEAQRRWREIGRTRAAYELCVTCVETANRHGSWETNPAEAVMQEYGKFGVWGAAGDERTRAFAELRALGMLVAAHWDEFDQAVSDLVGAVSLDDLRAAKRRPGRAR